jgi:hypothetical protein
MRDAADAGMQQRIVSFVSDACVLKFCLPNMRSTCRECGTGEGHMNERFGRLDSRLGVDQTALNDGRRYSSAIPEEAAGRGGAGRYSTHARRRGDAGATSTFESGWLVWSAR